MATLRVPHRRWPPVLTAVAFTLMFWAGNIWYTLPMLLSMGLLALAHLVHPRARTWPARLDWPALRRLALAAALTLGLSAVTFLPIWLQRGHIGGHPDVVSGGEVADLRAVIRQFYDGSLQQYLDGTAPGAVQFYYSFITPPWFVLLLFVVVPPIWPFLHRPGMREGWRVWLPAALMIGICTLWGAGGNPAIIWLYQHVPLLGQWRFVGRALAVASFWIGVLLAMRADALLRALIAPVRPVAALGWLGRRALSYGLALGLVFASGAAARQVNAQWRDFAGTIGVNVYDDICLSWLRARFPAQELTVYRPGYDAVIPFLTHKIRLFNVEADYFPRPRLWTVGNFDLTQSPPAYGLVWDDPGRLVMRQAGYVPIPDSPQPVDEHHCLWQRVAPTLSYAYAIPLGVIQTLIASELDPALTTPVAIRDRAPDTVVLGVQADDQSPLVITAQERAYPGWLVRVDGEPAPLESVGGQIGVILPPDGQPHEVVLAYRPPLVYLGGLLTLLTWAFCILYLLGADRPLRRRLERSLPGL